MHRDDEILRRKFWLFTKERSIRRDSYKSRDGILRE